MNALHVGSAPHVVAGPGKVGVLTISDRGSAGEYEDKSGPVICRIVTDMLMIELSN